MISFRPLVIATTVASVVLFAAPAASLTKYEKLELEGLSPTLRKQVEARMTGQQTVRGIMETMLLNTISDKVVYNQVVAIDFDKAVIVVTNPKGAMRAYSFDTSTLAIDSKSTPKPSTPVAAGKTK
jgi:hypothetical protein